MAAERVLAIDAGTSALRALIVSADGDVALGAVEPYHVFTPDDAAPFGREFNPADLAAALARLVENASREAEGGVSAVAFTGQREGIAFLDAAGACVFASPNVDARASAEGMAIDAARGDAVYAATGHLPSLMQAPAKLAWLREHRPRVAARVTDVLPLVDWLAMLLTGVPASSRNLAVENGLLDVASGSAPAALLEAAGFAEVLVPRVIADGSVAGEAGRGPFAGRPVVLAGGDTQCALVGMGALEAGQTGVPAGWSAPLQMVTASPVFDRERRTWTSVHAAPGAWILESNAGETGRAWEWTSNLLSVTPEAAGRIAEQSPIGSRDVMSLLGARAMRASEMSAGVGAITFPLPLVMSAPGLGDVLRSTIETAAYAVRSNLEQLESVSGTKVTRLHLGGGMSRIALFPQIVADVVDRPVELAASPETSALGAAMLAFTSLGRFPSLNDAAASWAGRSSVIEPRLRASADYEDYYARWCAMSDRMVEEAG